MKSQARWHALLLQMTSNNPKLRNSENYKIHVVPFKLNQAIAGRAAT